MITITEENKAVVQLTEVVTGILMLEGGKLDTIASLITSIIDECNDAPVPTMAPAALSDGDVID